MEFKGYQIRNSGKQLFKVVRNGEKVFSCRFGSIESAQAAILSQGRVMTRKEWSLVHSLPMPDEPTPMQALSEDEVRSGIIEGLL